jgi:hypothetical protein
MGDEEDRVQVPVAWVGVDDLPVLAVNQILLQNTSPEEFLLIFGQLAPPILLGSDDEKREQLRMLNFAPVRPVVRLALTRQRIDELRNLLDRHLKQFEAGDDHE